MQEMRGHTLLLTPRSSALKHPRTERVDGGQQGPVVKPHRGWAGIGGGMDGLG
jgi:hypothetical protein